MWNLNSILCIVTQAVTNLKENKITPVIDQPNNNIIWNIRFILDYALRLCKILGYFENNFYLFKMNAFIPFKDIISQNNLRSLSDS